MKTEFNHVKIQAFFPISLSQLHFLRFFCIAMNGLCSHGVVMTATLIPHSELVVMALASGLL